MRNLKVVATVTVTMVLLLGTVPNRVFAAPVEVDYMEYSSSVAARAAYVSNSSVTATGGTITEVGGYRIHTFTTSGTFTPNGGMNVEYLIVAGGGSGGARHSGGGGGGANFGTRGFGAGSALNSGANGTRSGASSGNSSGGNAGANTGSGGGGAGQLDASSFSGAGGSGIVIVRYPIPFLADSEVTIKTQGTYAIKSTAPITTSLNKTLTRTVSPTINLSYKTEITFDMRATRTGSNIKIGIHDSGGTTTEITPNITSANVYQTVTWDISGVSNANKDVIDQIIVTIVNADAANTFYLDNMAVNPLSPPQATGVSGTALGVSSITWNWTDNSSGQYQEDGFKVYCATSSELRNTAATDAVAWTETGAYSEHDISEICSVV